MSGKNNGYAGKIGHGANLNVKGPYAGGGGKKGGKVVTGNDLRDGK